MPQELLPRKINQLLTLRSLPNILPELFRIPIRHRPLIFCPFLRQNETLTHIISLSGPEKVHVPSCIYHFDYYRGSCYGCEPSSLLKLR